MNGVVHGGGVWRWTGCVGCETVGGELRCGGGACGGGGGGGGG